MITVEEIRTSYPNPSTHTGAKEDDYCVGGALCIYMYGSVSSRFPTHQDLASRLQEANYKLNKRSAYSFAVAITLLNDSGEFERAWEELGLALRWNRKVKKGRNDARDQHS